MKPVFTIKNIYFASAFSIFIYLILRAIFVPPVHDEAATFMHYIQRNEWKPFQAHWDANNHLLNSFLSSQIFKIFGFGTLQLRLASLIFFPLFVWFVWKISAFLKSNIVKIGFLCGMVGAHNLMEYFGYSRGYAMSMALLMASIFYILQYFQEFQLRKLWLFYLFSALALMANLTLFNTMLLLNGLLFLSFILKNKRWLQKFVFLVLGFLPIVGAAILSMKIKELGLLYYGGDRSFYHITVWSLVILIYDEWHTSIAVFFIVLACLGIVFLGAGGNREGYKNILFTQRWFFAILFLGNILATVLLQLLLKVNYPEDRTAMYFYFFLVLFFCFSLDVISIDKLTYLAVVWIVFPLHFIFNINLTHATYWYYEHLPNTFYQEINKRVGDHPEKVSIGGYVLMDMIWAYYNQANGGKLNDLQTNDYPSFYYDYLILYNDNNNAFAQDDYNILLSSPYSGIRVLERKEKIELKLITSYTFPDKPENWDEYTTFFESDSLKKYKNLCFDIKMDFKCPLNFFFGMMVLGAEQPQGQGQMETQQLHLLRTQWKKGYPFHHSIYMQNISPATNRIVCYFWNPRKQLTRLTNISISIYYW